MFATQVVNPTVVKVSPRKESYEYEAVELPGKFWRCHPSGPHQAREIFAIANLTHGERYAFASGAGHGICLTQAAFNRLTDLGLF